MCQNHAIKNADYTSYFFSVVVCCGLALVSKKVYELSDLDHIELLNEQTENNLKTLLDNMPVGVIQFDQETNAIEWYNPYAELIFTDEAGFYRNR